MKRDEIGKKRASGNHTNEVVVKQTTHMGNILNTFFSLSAKSLQENVLSWCRYSQIGQLGRKGAKLRVRRFCCK